MRHLILVFAMIINLLIFIVACGGGGGGGVEVVGEVGSLENCLASCALSIGDELAHRTCRFQCYAIWGNPDDDDDDDDDNLIDENAPSTPTNLVANVISYNQVDLSWSQSTDDQSGSIFYTLYRDSTKYFMDIDKTQISDFPNIKSSNKYCYSVVACDLSDNCSEQSSESCITTPGNEHFDWSSDFGVYLHDLIISNDTIYGINQTSLNTGTLFAINLDGTQKWSISNINTKDIGLVSNNGIVFCRSSDIRNLYAINSDGNIIWTFNDVDYISAVKVDGDVVYFVSGGALLAFNDDGTQNWSSPGFNEGTVAAIGNDSTIYVNSVDGYAWLLNAVNTDGTIKWTSNTGLFSYLFGADGTIYTLGQNEVRALNNNDGTIKWTFSPTGWDYSDELDFFDIGAGGTIYVDGRRRNSVERTLFAINTDGSLKWSFSYSNSISKIRPLPLIGSNDVVYVGSGTTLMAINNDGSLKWSYTTEGIQYLDELFSDPWSGWSLSGYRAIMLPSIIDTDGTVFVVNAGTLLAINPNGSLKWSYTAEDYHISLPVLNGDGTLFFGCWDNRLYAVSKQ